MMHVAEPWWESSSQNQRYQSPLCSCVPFDGADITDALLHWWVGGVGRDTYHPPPFNTQTQMSRLISLCLSSKEIYPSTAVITSWNTHSNSRPVSLRFEITLPVSPFFYLRSVKLQMRQNGRCRGGVRRGNIHSKSSASSVYRNSQLDGRMSSSSCHIAGLLRRFKSLMWWPWIQKLM